MSVDLQTAPISTRLLDWYDENARSLPWRLPPGSAGRPDPYGVWLAEIMLQQTTVAAVARYWTRFRTLWPTVSALAEADDADVMREWAGLGYYARARNLLAAARQVASVGAFPQCEAGLRELPGVGPYTAAAIAAIAFGERSTVIDANVERVVARYFALPDPLPAGRAKMVAALGPHVPADRPGDFAQAMMDLGSGVCRVRAPRCEICPLRDGCAAFAMGRMEEFPVKAAKPVRPHRQGIAWWIEHKNEVALVRRPAKGLLGGMLALPGTAWGDVVDAKNAPLAADWQDFGKVRHVFTHFELHLGVIGATVRSQPRHIADQPLVWTPREKLAVVGLPTLYARAVALVMPELR